MLGKQWLIPVTLQITDKANQYNLPHKFLNKSMRSSENVRFSS